MPDSVKIATRGSELALWQANLVASLLPMPTEVAIVETEGDRSADCNLAEIGGQGVFVKDVQQQLLDRRARLAVHSAKDLPSAIVGGLEVGAWLSRADPRDVIVGSLLKDLPRGARVGTSSTRRAAQLLALRPDVEIEILRGNIRTRLTKGQRMDAIFVAAAALERLDLHPSVMEILDPEVMLPQVGQGVIAVECRSDDSEMLGLLASINDGDTQQEILAERSFLQVFGTGCSLPIGGFARTGEDRLTLYGMVAKSDGTRVLRAAQSGDEPIELGRSLAKNLIERGALELLSVAEPAE
jgi:hydroxymethylbilane synthase